MALTPNLSLTTYNTTSASLVNFQDWFTETVGDTVSNMTKIDDFAGNVSGSLSGLTDLYIKRKHGQKMPKQHQLVEKITKDTFGIILYLHTLYQYQMKSLLVLLSHLIPLMRLFLEYLASLILQTQYHIYPNLLLILF